MSTSFDTPVPPSSAGEGRTSIGDLFSDVSADITLLLRQEVELAKAELRESATRAGKGAGMFGGAGIAAHMVLLFGSIAVWWAIGDGIGRGWSALLVAVIWLVIGVALAMVGKRELIAVQGVAQTTDTVKKIPSALKGKEAA